MWKVYQYGVCKAEVPALGNMRETLDFIDNHVIPALMLDKWPGGTHPQGYRDTFVVVKT
jgi:hypothetical protein